MTEHIVPAGVEPLPLKTYLKRAYPALPGWALRDALKKKDVRVNGARSGGDALVQSGDLLRIYIDDRFLGGELKVIWAGEGLLAVEKPAGLPVDRDGGNVGEDTLLSRIQARYPGAKLCHRLDAGTGGVLIAATDPAAWERAVGAFRERQVEKVYRCLVKGVPSPAQARLSAYLKKDAQSARVRVSDAPLPGGLPIETGYRVLASRPEMSLLEVELFTGRTHQIRAHLAHLGHPLAGDDKYGDRAFNRAAGRETPALWCVRIGLLGHTFESPAPFDLPGE